MAITYLDNNQIKTIEFSNRETAIKFEHSLRISGTTRQWHGMNKSELLKFYSDSREVLV